MPDLEWLEPGGDSIPPYVIARVLVKGLSCNKKESFLLEGVAEGVVGSEHFACCTLIINVVAVTVHFLIAISSKLFLAHDLYLFVNPILLSSLQQGKETRGSEQVAVWFGVYQWQH